MKVSGNGWRGGWQPQRAEKGPLIIFGTGNVADVAYEFFAHDSEYEVVAFAVSREQMKSTEHFGIPVVAFEDVKRLYPPGTHRMFVAIGYAKLNHVRAKVCKQAKQLGYELASYVSTSAFIWRDVTVGENCFILEDNVIQPFVEIGDGVILWSGNHIGHGTKIRDYVYLASHVVISGFVEIGEYTFMGVNATVADDVKIGKNCLIGAGATILKNTEPREVFGASMTKSRKFETLSEKARNMYEPPED